MLFLNIHMLCTYSFGFCMSIYVFNICHITLSILHTISITSYNLLYYYMIQQIREYIMARKVDERIPEEMFIKLLAKKTKIIKEHLQNSLSQLIIVANIGPTMATFKLYDLKEEDSIKLYITLSNLAD